MGTPPRKGFIQALRPLLWSAAVFYVAIVVYGNVNAVSEASAKRRRASFQVIRDASFFVGDAVRLGNESDWLIKDLVLEKHSTGSMDFGSQTEKTPAVFTMTAMNRKGARVEINAPADMRNGPSVINVRAPAISEAVSAIEGILEVTDAEAGVLEGDINLKFSPVADVLQSVKLHVVLHKVLRPSAVNPN